MVLRTSRRLGVALGRAADSVGPWPANWGDEGPGVGRNSADSQFAERGREVRSVRAPRPASVRRPPTLSAALVPDRRITGSEA